MRRWFCIFLLTLLPLQFSWAAAAGYCAHESRMQTWHLGHHEHAHTPGDGSADVAAAPAADDDSGVSATSHADCGPCHGLGVGVPMPLAAMAEPIAVRDAAPCTASGRLLRATAPPDRPQWLPLA